MNSRTALAGFVREKLLPPILRARWVRWRAKSKFSGNYSSWAEAISRCKGYEDRAILDRVLQATLAVHRGEAAFERDGVLFLHNAADYPLLSCLLRIAAVCDGRLRVLDFGGALGSTYWRHRDWFSGLAEFRWDIVEQSNFVSAGNEHLATTPLRFYSTIDDACSHQIYDVLLVSTTLQYLEDPVAALKSWLEKEFLFLLFNNLPLHDHSPDRLAIQRVDASIYPAAYPVWFFNRDAFLSRLMNRYRLQIEYLSEAEWYLDARSYPSTGLLLSRSPL